MQEPYSIYEGEEVLTTYGWTLIQKALHYYLEHNYLNFDDSEEWNTARILQRVTEMLEKEKSDA